MIDESFFSMIDEAKVSSVYFILRVQLLQFCSNFLFNFFDTNENVWLFCFGLCLIFGEGAQDFGFTKFVITMNDDVTSYVFIH